MSSASLRCNWTARLDLDMDSNERKAKWNTHVFIFKLIGTRNHDTRGCLLVLALVFLPIFEKSQATIPNGTTFHTQVFNSGRSVVSQSSPSIIVRRHESHRQPSAPAVKSGRAEQSSFWTSLWKRDDEQECEDNHDCLLPAKAHLQPGLPGPRFGSEIKNKLLMMIVIAASDFLLKIRL
ncbi:hypothetical protein H4Q26_004064 [Puccinia striiformis f. sp. tritici PST-130]|nr:hypothetical protein H4Q26_004064 [Puccinia striiformis f. sp. tritici PST-130]